MRKIVIIIPLIILLASIIIAGTIAGADSEPIMSEQTLIRDEALEAQKQIVLMAVSQKDPAKTTAALDQMILQYSRNENLPQALYDLGCDSSDISKDDSIQIHYYNIAMFPENIYAMQSQLEIFNIHYDSGDIETADTDIQSLIENFSSQPALPKELYKIAGKYNYAGKRTKANEIYTAAAQYSPDDMYVQLSQIFCDITNDDSVSLYSNLASLIEEHFDDSQLAEEIYNTAVNCGYADQHQYAIQFYQQLLETWPDANQAPYATQRMAIEYSKIGDETNADIAIEKLKYDYGDFPRKAENFWKLGQYYRLDADMYDKASGLYEFGANNSPKEDDHTMFCQIELVKYFIRSGDLDTGDEQFEKLTAEFAENPWLASSICFIGDVYLAEGYIDTADTLYADVLSKWPDDPQSIFALAGIAKIDIALGEESAAEEIVDNLVADYKDDSALPEALFQIGEQYWKLTGSKLSKDRNEHTYDYLGRAMAVWKRIEDLPPVDITPKAAFFVAECYFCSDMPQDAIVAYQAFADNWKEHKYACLAQERIVNVYVKMIIDGSMSMPEAEAQIEVIYEELLEQSPNGSQSIRNKAQRWLNYYRKKMKKETGILSDERIISTFEQQANQGGSQ